MQDLEEFLNFTMETVDDFATGFLPTLDTDLGVTELNEVLYKFYEKPMCSNVCVQKLSAMDENSKVKTLSNELTRRLLNSSESLGNKERVRVVDVYTQKLINSGYGVEQIRRNVINGIKGYERKLKESKEGGRRLHRTSAESSGKRAKKKLMDKTEWFRNSKKKTGEGNPADDIEPNKTGIKNKEKNSEKQKKPQNVGSSASQMNIRTRTVIFVEQTRNGQLAKDIRLVLSRIEHILGFRAKVVERTGSTIKKTLPNTDPWTGGDCGRQDCVTCVQEGEEKPPCNKRGLVYENICLVCNPEASKKGELLEMNMEVPSIYVGETARSIKERSKEHWDLFRRNTRTVTY